MYYNKVEICGIDTSKIKTLKESEKIELIKKAQAGDLNAQDKLVYGNLRLVLSVVQKFTNRTDNLDDLFQVGCIGLIKAIKNFNCNLNVRFSTYGVPMILGEIKRFLRDNNMIRVSRSMRDTAYQAMQTKENFIKDNNREPTINEIADIMQRPTIDIVTALQSISEPSSLYEPVYSDGRDTIYLMDQISDKTSDEQWLEAIAIRQAITHLTDREKLILSLRFVKGETQIEVAKKIGISQAQVSRIEKNTLEKIKKQL